jgi:hypothetical protein
MTERRELGVFAEPLARITCYNDLVEALLARKIALGLSDAELEHQAFLGAGHVNKIFGPTPIKGIGSSTLETLMHALAVDFIMVSSPEKLAKMEVHKCRQKSHVRANRRVSNRARTESARHAAKSRWANSTPEQRSQAAIYMNHVRWGRHRIPTEPEK